MKNIQTYDDFVNGIPRDRSSQPMRLDGILRGWVIMLWKVDFHEEYYKKTVFHSPDFIFLYKLCYIICKFGGDKYVHKE